MTDEHEHAANINEYMKSSRKRAEGTYLDNRRRHTKTGRGIGARATDWTRKLSMITEATGRVGIYVEIRP